MTRVSATAAGVGPYQAVRRIRRGLLIEMFEDGGAAIAQSGDEALKAIAGAFEPFT